MAVLALLAGLLFAAGCWNTDDVSRPKPGDLARAVVHSLPESASVWWDGVAQAPKTPLTIDDEPGVHQVRCVLSGYQPWEQQVELKGGEVRSVYAMLTDARTAWLDISSVPSGLPVWVDNRATGQVTPVRLGNVPIGTRSVRLPAPRFYHDWDDTLHLTASGRALHAELAPKRLERDGEIRTGDGNGGDGLAMWRRYLFVQSFDDLVVLDGRDPLHPTESGRLLAQGDFRAVAADSAYVFVVENRPDRLLVVGLSSSGAPSIVGQLALTGAARTPFAIDSGPGHVYIGGCCGGAIVDVTDPRRPVLTAYLPISRGEVIRVDGSRAYCSDGEKIRVIDIRRPDLPVVTDSLVVRYAGDILKSGDLLVVSGSSSLRIYSAPDAGGFLLRHEMATASTAEYLSLVGDTLFYAHPTDLGIVDLKDRDQPSEVEHFAPVRGGGFGPIAATRKHVFACEGHYLAVYSRRPAD